jgi:predicted NAD-dependent protein-ADP-ribosyltransferase YbiA (DUF1768 family)
MSETDRVIQKMKNILAIMENMGDVIPQFPTTLDEPRIYLSRAQTDICKRNDKLKHLVLPGWVRLRLVADALDYGQDGINRAMEYTGHKPWLWATEFENVHTTWKFEEPRLNIGGKEYKDSETYYKSQQDPVRSVAKAAEWDLKKEEVMRKAVWAKFEASQEARDLLISTHPHPLLSIKDDTFYGFHPEYGGQNKLAEILMDLRQKYVDGTRYRSMDGR